MKKEIKLGIGIAVIFFALFMLILGVGKVNKDSEQDLPTEETEQISEVTESTEIAEGETEGAEEETKDEYISFAIADVNSYVNVRQEPNTDCAILGKIFDGAVAQILEVVGEGDNQWFRIISGNVEGYVKNSYCVYGQDALAYAKENVDTSITTDKINANFFFIMYSPSI